MRLRVRWRTPMLAAIAAGVLLLSGLALRAGDPPLSLPPRAQLELRLDNQTPEPSQPADAPQVLPTLAPPGQAPQVPQPRPATAQPEPLDRAAIQKLIREEMKAQQEQKKQDSDKGAGKKEGEKKGEEDKERKDGRSFEVGKDLKLTTTWQDGVVAQTEDQAFRLHFGGRLEFDNTWFTQDNNLLLGPSAGTRLADGTLFRRARLHADGQLWEFIDFVAEVNFANIQDVSNVENSPVQVGSVGLTQCHLTFREVPGVGNVRVGHFKPPVGLERSTSSNVWYYMERSSLYDAFLGPNNYQNGVEVFNSYLDDRVTLAGSFTRHGKSDVQSFGFGAEDGQYAVSVRATALPLYLDEGRTLMHVGAGYSHQTLRGHTFAVADRFLLRSGAGSQQTPNVLAIGTFFTPNGADLLDVEWALVLGRFALSAEYAVGRITNVFDNFDGLTFSGPRGDATYQAAYVEAGWFLTPGDGRRYDRKTGTWARTVPQENAFLAKSEDGGWCSGHGAVQLLARYTYLDLVSGSPVLTPPSISAGAQAGRQHDVTLGVNWYLNSQTVVMVNYVWTHLDSVVPGASGNLQGLGCRVHLDF